MGVEYERGGEIVQARARREVIVCGGAVNSPQLLQLSGIGPAGASAIDRHTRVARSSRRRLQSDRSSRRVAGLSGARRDFRQSAPSRRPTLREIARWCLFGTGALTFGVSTASLFARMREGRISPDLQILFTPATYDQSRFGELEREPGMTAAVCAVNPQSRGTIMAARRIRKWPPKFARIIFRRRKIWR